MTKVYVTNIQINTNCYKGNPHIVNVDLANTRTLTNVSGSNSYGTLYHTFENCTNLESVTNISPEITNLQGTFINATNFKDTFTIPNTVISIDDAFRNCTSFINTPDIPSSVISMVNAFTDCTNLITATNIPNSVTNIDNAFYNCTNLTTIPNLPSSITNMSLSFYNTNIQTVNYIPSLALNIAGAFKNCLHLSKNVKFVVSPQVIDMSETFMGCNNYNSTFCLPDSVTNMANTFNGCRSYNSISGIHLPTNVIDLSDTFSNCAMLFRSPVIPNNVQNMVNTFADCPSLMGPIYIKSNQIINAMNCFSNSYIPKNVYIPFTYENGVNTLTYNAFIAAGYDINGSQNGIYLRDYSKNYTVTIQAASSTANVNLTISSYKEFAGTNCNYVWSLQGGAYTSFFNIIVNCPTQTPSSASAFTRWATPQFTAMSLDELSVRTAVIISNLYIMAVGNYRRTPINDIAQVRQSAISTITTTLPAGCDIFYNVYENGYYPTTCTIYDLNQNMVIEVPPLEPVSE